MNMDGKTYMANQRIKTCRLGVAWDAVDADRTPLDELGAGRARGGTILGGEEGVEPHAVRVGTHEGYNSHLEAAIIVDPDRIRGSRLACEKFRTDLLILDDGFQHLRMQRDVNLCLFSSHDLEAGWDRVIPAGSWREDASALSRADAFLINTTADDDGCLEIMAHIKLAGMGKPLFFFRISAHGVANALTGAAMPSLEKIRYLLVTGIAIPEKMAQTCQTDLKEQPIRHLIYPDHQLDCNHERKHQ